MVTDYQKIRNTIEEYLLIQLRGGGKEIINLSFILLGNMECLLKKY